LCEWTPLSGELVSTVCSVVVVCSYGAQLQTKKYYKFQANWWEDTDQVPYSVSKKRHVCHNLLKKALGHSDHCHYIQWWVNTVSARQEDVADATQYGTPTAINVSHVEFMHAVFACIHIQLWLKCESQQKVSFTSLSNT